MLRVENVIKDIEDNLLDGSDLIESLVYNQGNNSTFEIHATVETINFLYKTNGIKVIETSVPYEMFWKPATIKEVVSSVMETVLTVGRLGEEQFND